MKDTLSTIAGIVFLVGFIPYITDVLRRKTVPVRTSWFIWAITECVATYGMYVKGAMTGQILASAIGSSIVALLTLKYGRKEWDFWNKVCAGGAVIGIVLCIVGAPILAIIASIVCISLGAVLTIRSMLEDPSKESKAGWTIYWLSCLIAVPAIKAWTTEDALQPVSFFLIDSVVMYVLYLRPRPPQVASKASADVATPTPSSTLQ